MGKRAVSSKLSEYVNKEAKGTIGELLPLVHSCKATEASDRIFKNEINVTDCDVFNKKNLYLFLGKPGYVIEPNMEKSCPDASMCPVCFVIRPESVISIERIYPFDSGAYHNGLYAKFDETFNSVDMESFRLANLNDVKKYIEVFFGTYDAYWEETPTIKETSIAELDLFIKLLTSDSATDTDQRCGIVEFINAKNLRISKCVEAVILPAPLARKKDEKTHLSVAKVLEANNIKIISYQAFPKTKPIYYVSQIMDLVAKHIKEGGLLANA